jgi:hypothetical protein
VGQRYFFPFGVILIFLKTAGLRRNVRCASNRAAGLSFGNDSLAGASAFNKKMHQFPYQGSNKVEVKSYLYQGTYMATNQTSKVIHHLRRHLWDQRPAEWSQ